jgi:hypothetical protein
MNANTKLPRAVDEVTPQWLTTALRSSCSDISVTRVSIDHIVWGTATKILLDVQYEGDPVPYGLPNKLCVKGEFDDRSRRALGGMTHAGTQVEAMFFNELAPQLGIPLPRHWYGGSEPGMGILVLDNLLVKGFSFGSPSEPWPPDRVAKALDILALLHASTWNKRFPEFSWLTVGSIVIRQAAETLMSDQHWQAHFIKPEVYKLPAELADNRRILNAYRALWSYDDVRAHCVIHGDAHLGNTCVDPSGQPLFIDWSGPCYSHWGVDVPYFIVGALSIDDRRVLERELFTHYLDRLHLHGGPLLEPAEAWEDYRRHIVHGMMWATLPPALQPLENVHAMGERYATAMIEHQTLRLIGV